MKRRLAVVLGLLVILSFGLSLIEQISPVDISGLLGSYEAHAKKENFQEICDWLDANCPCLKVPGPPGAQGEKGDKGDGDKGNKGDKGNPGQMPEHQWQGTRLSFQNPNGTWGPFVDLQGEPGSPGPECPQRPQVLEGPKGDPGELPSDIKLWLAISLSMPTSNDDVFYVLTALNTSSSTLENIQIRLDMPDSILIEKAQIGQTERGNLTINQDRSFLTCVIEKLDKVQQITLFVKIRFMQLRPLYLAQAVAMWKDCQAPIRSDDPLTNAINDPTIVELQYP